jgi:hypothetical protein
LETSVFLYRLRALVKCRKLMLSSARLATLIPVLVLSVAPLLALAIIELTVYWDIIFNVGSFYISTIDIGLITLSISYGLLPILYNKFGLFINNLGKECILYHHRHCRHNPTILGHDNNDWSLGYHK